MRKAACSGSLARPCPCPSLRSTPRLASHRLASPRPAGPPLTAPACSYILNLKSERRSPDLLWQIKLVAPEPFRWTTLAFPFADMILTKRGRVEMAQHPVERECIQGWGASLACRAP